MIYIADCNPVAGKLVFAACCRAFTSSQVKHIAIQHINNLLAQRTPLFVVLIDPTDDCVSFLTAARQHKAGAKILLLGKLTAVLRQYLQARVLPVPENFVQAAYCESAPANSFTESKLRVRYVHPLGVLASPLLERAFLRYDFRDEWNNLGYGAIRADDSIWALAELVTVPLINLLAEVLCDTESLSAYAAHWEDVNASLLWFNRSVGPIDSQEWRLVEHFFASYRYAELPCLPVLSEIPAGWDAVVTMRLDCDEDIESARALFESYQAWQVPFSLAIHTSVLEDKRHQKIIREVIANHGAILSHSETHPVQWGGGYEAAFNQACSSADAINAVLGAVNRVRYAVSPFHHTPPYALQALADANYQGCVGGIISSDPEFMLARGGFVLDEAPQFIGHSQSCMLHGECLLNSGDPLSVYKEAFNIARRGRALFGFLDHPFSERYTYGWATESERIAAHQHLLEYIRSQGRVLFLNEQVALDFIRCKSAIQLSVTTGMSYRLPNQYFSQQLKVVVEYAGSLVTLSEEGVFA